MHGSFIVAVVVGTKQYYKRFSINYYTLVVLKMLNNT